MANVDGWDPAQYGRFQAERRQPFDDLLSLLAPVPRGRAVDLGCGSGELTAALHERLGCAQTIGMDRSAAMLGDRDRWAGGGVEFQLRDIESFPRPDGEDGSFDVIAANASLHWVDDHPRLLARLTAALRPGGQLAFQIPANFDHPSHAVAAAVAAEPPFADLLVDPPGSRGATVLSPVGYAVLLHQLGFARQVVRLQVYGHLLGSTGEVVEWVKGTVLTPYRERLDDNQYEAFVQDYRARLLAAVGDQRPYFFPFKRILAWARLP